MMKWNSLLSCFWFLIISLCFMSASLTATNLTSMNLNFSDHYSMSISPLYAKEEETRIHDLSESTKHNLKNFTTKDVVQGNDSTQLLKEHGKSHRQPQNERTLTNTEDENEPSEGNSVYETAEAGQTDSEPEAEQHKNAHRNPSSHAETSHMPASNVQRSPSSSPEVKKDSKGFLHALGGLFVCCLISRT